jgi:cell division protein FtsB
MEIHTPDAPVHSFRDFIVHLLMISLGVLIALGAEGLVEFVHNRHTVAEARSNLMAEMRENKATLDANLPKLKHNQELIEQTFSDIQKIKADRKAKMRDIDLNLNFFGLTDTSWRTAQATGALALMKYDQVQDFAGFYDLQAMLNRLVSNLEDTWLNMTTAFNPLGSDPAKMEDRQLDEVQRQLDLSLGRLIAVENIGRSLDNLYSKKLNSK